jgi:hypothetical protein
MKMTIFSLLEVGSLALGSAALADAKTLVITGRVVELSEQNITVEKGKERVEINYADIRFSGKYAGNAKVGDTVKVYYTTGHHVYRADPDNWVTKLELIPAGASKK